MKPKKFIYWHDIPEPLRELINIRNVERYHFFNIYFCSEDTWAEIKAMTGVTAGYFTGPDCAKEDLVTNDDLIHFLNSLFFNDAFSWDNTLKIYLDW